jgi:hypothetical protein
LLTFAVGFLKPPLAVLQYGSFHIRSGSEFRLQIFSEPALILGGSTHLCFKLLIGTKVSLQFPLPSAGGYAFGVATGLKVSASAAIPP